MNILSIILFIVIFTMAMYAMYHIGYSTAMLDLLKASKEVIEDESEEHSDDVVSQLSDLKDLIGEEAASELKENRKLLFQAGASWSLRRIFEKTCPDES